MLQTRKVHPLDKSIIIDIIHIDGYLYKELYFFTTINRSIQICPFVLEQVNNNLISNNFTMMTSLKTAYYSTSTGKRSLTLLAAGPLPLFLRKHIDKSKYVYIKYMVPYDDCR